MKALALLAATVALAGCGSDEPASGPRPSTSPDGALWVDEAVESGRTGTLAVRGYLLERGGEVRLCAAILESYPPQCGEPSLGIEGDVERPARDEPVTLRGEVAGGVIRVGSDS